jgi:hypothetical protein
MRSGKLRKADVSVLKDEDQLPLPLKKMSGTGGCKKSLSLSLSKEPMYVRESAASL